MSVVGLKSLDVSSCNELLTGSPGRWIPGLLGRWVTKCDPVPSLLHVTADYLLSGQTDGPDVHRTVA